MNGLFQCQFSGADEQTFVGGIAVGSPGTIPFGLTAPVSPPGSCPANPSGPVPDGQQLVDITQNPGVPVAATGGSAATTDVVATAAATGDNAATAPAVAATSTAAAVVAPPAAAAPTAAASSGDFHLQNGQDAQALNAQFESLTATSACTGQLTVFIFCLQPPMTDMTFS